MTSVEASRKFKDKSMDIVFIDAQHSYPEVKKDISAWKKKIREGGILCGHDYNNRYADHVVKAVDEAFPEKKLKLNDNAIWAIRL